MLLHLIAERRRIAAPRAATAAEIQRPEDDAAGIAPADLKVRVVAVKEGPRRHGPLQK
jgi:hypothetical protein